jgi:hypothetical protein
MRRVEGEAMRRVNPSWTALVIATTALFTALGGPAWAAGLINGSQIKNGSIRSNKIGRAQVKAVNLAAGAVHSTNLATGAVMASNVAPDSLTGADVAPGSLTAADVAPGTFLAATGTAANSDQLDGLTASRFVQGTGNLIRNRIDITVGTSRQFLLDTGLGEIDGSCLAGDKPEVSFTAEAQRLNLIEWGTTFGTSPDINTNDALVIGSTYTEPNASGLPQAIEFQVAQDGVTPARVATVWTTDQAIGGTDCLFTAQALTTGV